MRIIAGKYKGRRLYTATSHIRPTTDRIKEHIFTILDPFLHGKEVCDLFSGSGSLGLESLSRGAEQVVFVEKSFQSIQVLKKNIQRFEIDDDHEIIHSNVISFLNQNTQPFDFVLADPPFKWSYINELIDGVFKENNLKQDGVFVLESEKSHKVQWESEKFEIIQQKKYDRSIITFFGWRLKNE